MDKEYLHKRNFSRIVIEYKAKLEVSGVVFEGSVINLSMKGAFFKTAKLIPIDSIVRLTVIVQGTPPILIETKGKVVRKAQDGVGIQITEVDIDSYMELKNILTYNSEDTTLVDQELASSIAKKKI